MKTGFRPFVGTLLLTLLAACAPVGPEFVKPDVDLPAEWSATGEGHFAASGIEQSRWWQVFEDPVLDELVTAAWQRNNTLEIAGLRVLEARAQLGIAQGNLYPQSQLAAGSGVYTSPADNFGGGSGYWQYGIGASVSWEIDFWGRFRRGIESADAAYLSSIEARNQALVILTAQVVNTYTAIRVNQEQLRIARDNVDIQQRSFDIASVLFRNGADSELDMQQASTLLLSTQATIPGYETAVQQSLNALNVLLGNPPGRIDSLVNRGQGIPALPETIETGVPADLLRRRPDVRQAEFNAMAQNALVGLAEADLYPSFSLTGSIGLASGGPGDTNFGDLFGTEALTFSVGPSFVWPFLNYGRIRNNVRVQDARLQQALVNYRETVIQAAREVEDAITSLSGSLAQEDILVKTVASAKRSNELSVLRYREGFSDYQRVLEAQKSLFSQQQRLNIQRGTSVASLVALYQALGGGWQAGAAEALISEENRAQMQQRTNWGELLDGEASNSAKGRREAKIPDKNTGESKVP